MASTLESDVVRAAEPAAPTSALAAASAQLSALLHGAGFAPLDDTGWIRVTGSDRVRWLNGMVTNSIQDLAPGEGCYNFVLNAQGRIQGDLTAFALLDSIVVETTRDQFEKLTAYFDRFIIMDDVELVPFPNESLPVSHQNPERDGLLVAGPQAEAMLQRIGIDTGQSSALTLHSTAWKGNRLDVIRAYSPLVPRFEIWSDLTNILMIWQALDDAGAARVSPEALEHLRILEGTPRYGTDIRNTETARDLPQETGQTRALHFAKGCYLGQEIVERIRSRGNVHRTFTGFRLTPSAPGDIPQPGTLLQVEGKAVGELTSVAALPLPVSATGLAAGSTTSTLLALGYVRREALDRGLPLAYPGGTAAPVALPFATV